MVYQKSAKFYCFLLAQFAQLSQFATYGQDFLSYHDTKPGQQV